MTDAELTAFVDEFVAKLGEQFDAVQILVSWNEDSKTRDLYRGCGNVHARLNMARDFIERDKAQIMAYEIKASE